MRAHIAAMCFLSTGFVAGVLGKSAGQEVARPAKGFAGCVQPEQIDGSQSLGFKNTCAANMQFTISWTGAHPTQNSTYHVAGNGARQVTKADEHWSFSGEAPATFDNGPTGSVTVVERATNVQDLDRLFFHNDHASVTFADVTIKLYNLPPITSVSTIHRQVVLDPKGDYSCCFFDKTVFAKYEVSAVKAEDDPQ